MMSTHSKNSVFDCFESTGTVQTHNDMGGEGIVSSGWTFLACPMAEYAELSANTKKTVGS